MKKLLLVLLLIGTVNVAKSQNYNGNWKKEAIGADVLMDRYEAVYCTGSVFDDANYEPNYDEFKAWIRNPDYNEYWKNEFVATDILIDIYEEICCTDSIFVYGYCIDPNYDEFKKWIRLNYKSKATTKMYIIEFEKGVYSADLEGDPGRTVKKENARRFNSNVEANIVLADLLQEIKPFRTFPNAKIIPINAEVDNEDCENEDEEILGYECMSCGNIQGRQNGFGCDRCSAPLTDWYG